MRCPEHGLVREPDGGCVLCRRRTAKVARRPRRGRDRARALAIVVVAFMAAVATFFLAGALLDTR